MSRQTPTTTMRAWRGLLRKMSSIMPGTPTHSNTTTLSRLAISAVCQGERSFGSTTTSAPAIAAPDRAVPASNRPRRWHLGRAAPCAWPANPPIPRDPPARCRLPTRSRRLPRRAMFTACRPTAIVPSAPHGEPKCRSAPAGPCVPRAACIHRNRQALAANSRSAALAGAQRRESNIRGLPASWPAS